MRFRGAEAGVEAEGKGCGSFCVLLADDEEEAVLNVEEVDILEV